MPFVPQLWPCDGCGQPADSQHIALRLQRLEWATRFRPIHIQTVLLSGIAPARNDEFLYHPGGGFAGEARRVFDAVQITTAGKSPESALTEFQKCGLTLVHVLECPVTPARPSSDAQLLLENHLAAAITRIRRSLKPKRVLLVGSELQAVADKLRQTDLGCPVYPAVGSVFLWNATPTGQEFEAFRAVLGASYAQPV